MSTDPMNTTSELKRAGIVSGAVTGALTVGELLEALADVDPSTRLLMDDGNGWYTYVMLTVPVLGDDSADPDTGYSLPTILTGAPFDSRDL